jgi:hypothetical protein
VEALGESYRSIRSGESRRFDEDEDH